MNWKTGSYTEGRSTVWTNPNGNPKDNVGYYTQTRKFYDEYKDHWNQYWDEHYAKDPIQEDEDKWNNWAEMHEDVLWFDTAACWAGPFIGQVNSVVISPDLGTNP